MPYACLPECMSVCGVGGGGGGWYRFSWRTHVCLCACSLTVSLSAGVAASFRYDRSLAPSCLSATENGPVSCCWRSALKGTVVVQSSGSRAKTWSAPCSHARTTARTRAHHCSALTRRHARTHACTHARARARTHTHTHTPVTHTISTVLISPLKKGAMPARFATTSYTSATAAATRSGLSGWRSDRTGRQWSCFHRQ